MLKRAPDDVGGLLDPSKGWTLSIPDPNTDPNGSAAKLIASQEPKPATTAAATVPSITQVASR